MFFHITTRNVALVAFATALVFTSTQANAADRYTTCIRGGHNAVSACKQIISKRLVKGEKLAYVYAAYARALWYDPDEADAALTQAINIKKNYTAAYQNRGVIRLENGDARSAKRDLEMAVLLSPNKASAHFDLGNAYTAAKEYESAISELRKATEISRKFAEAYNNLGYVHTLKSDYKSALPYFTKAVNLKPRNKDFRFNRASVNEILGQKGEAIRDYQEVLSYDTNEAEVRDALRRLGVNVRG